MVKERTLGELRQKFEFLKEEVLGILVYGSQVKEKTTPRSDIDICIVLGKEKTEEIRKVLKKVWRRVDLQTQDLDVKVFEELPLHLKADIINHHEVLISSSKPELYEYLYRFRKLWNDQKHRQVLTEKERKRILSNN